MSTDQKKAIEQMFKAPSAENVQGQFVPVTSAAAFCKAGCSHHCTG